MKIILRATEQLFNSICEGIENRIEVEKDVRDFLLSHGTDTALVMAGYPLRPVSIEKKISTILLDSSGRSWVVFAVSCARCEKKQFCKIQCDGVEYERKKSAEKNETGGFAEVRNAKKSRIFHRSLARGLP